jgi:integrase
LLAAALQHRPPHSLRPQTYATLIGLLAVTGLRVSEALALQFSDVTPRGLLVRKTKFQKTRLVPLHDSAAAALDRYLMRRRKCARGESVFSADDGRPLRYLEVYATFQKLLETALLSPARRPRLHDLRHHADSPIMPTLLK